MPRFVRALHIVCLAGLLSALTMGAAQAQLCASNAECRSPLQCNKWLFGVAGSCERALCNADTDCRTTEICSLGICQIACLRDVNCPAGLVCVHGTGDIRGRGVCTEPEPPPPAPSSPGPGTPLPGLGQACGPRNMGGGVIKTIPCRPGLQCRSGRCQRPPS
jgi:hypothetical protein